MESDGRTHSLTDGHRWLLSRYRDWKISRTFKQMIKQTLRGVFVCLIISLLSDIQEIRDIQFIFLGKCVYNVQYEKIWET